MPKTTLRVKISSNDHPLTKNYKTPEEKSTTQAPESILAKNHIFGISWHSLIWEDFWLKPFLLDWLPRTLAGELILGAFWDFSCFQERSQNISGIFRKRSWKIPGNFCCSSSIIFLKTTDTCGSNAPRFIEKYLRSSELQEFSQNNSKKSPKKVTVFFHIRYLAHAPHLPSSPAQPRGPGLTRRSTKTNCKKISRILLIVM